MPDSLTELKRKALEKYFDRMNEPQKKAVFKINGPLLILAGAGSGKTTVLINRIANMIRFGDAYNYTAEAYYTEEQIRFLGEFAKGNETDGAKLAELIAFRPVRPYNILAITFTNKAAKELQTRLETMLGEEGNGIMASTFHSLCARILRRESEHIGYGKTFTIYDTDDQQRVCKAILRDLDINEKLFPPKDILTRISRFKDKMMDPKDAMADASDYYFQTVARVYDEYQNRLIENNAMDFDDLLCNTVRLFESNPDVLDHYQNLYKYIMVDEYQDTNPVQFRLVAMLAEKNGNICVVGDDDQSIYRFRGATIENILSFEDTFNCDPETDVIRLEQNYRSTQNILTCANELIKNNTERKGKNLWTAIGDGDAVTVFKAADERREAAFVAETVLDNLDNGFSYKDQAVLYRTNAQSREVELALSKSAIPYRIYGGLKFYDRKEIRDILAYLQVINNENDMLRLRRIINEPKRGIGDATVGVIEQVSSDLKLSPIEVMLTSDELAPLAGRAKKLKSVAEMFKYFADLADAMPLGDLLDELLDKSGYRQMLIDEGEEGVPRLENIGELKTSMAQYEMSAEEPTLSGYLEEIALYTDMDRYDENEDYVSLMTMHSAKGLEFPCVYVIGMEENLFPSARCLESESEVQEERRLAYVAITRAKKKLYLIHAESRLLYGNYQHNRPSRFIRELPAECIEKKNDPSAGSFGSSQSGGFESVHSMTLQQQIAQRKTSHVSESSDIPKLEIGDRVLHKIFGEGTVLKVTPMANDCMLEIAFDTRGTKRVMEKFAKIKKI